MTVENDGPFGKAPDISVGASDTALLVVSFGGFFFLAFTVYSIVLTKLKSRQEIEEEEQELNYEERLVAADVSTLNRAQRRARARHIMKQQRRITPINSTENGEENNDVNHENGRANEMHHLSRRERQRNAKAAEKEERRLFEEERRKQQEEAQRIAKREKKERERLLNERAELERKARQEQRVAEEAAAYETWKIFLSSPDGRTVLSVKEFKEELKENRICQLTELAKRFSIQQQEVASRIDELIASMRLTGIHEGGTFTFISMEEMKLLSSWIQTRDVTSLTEIKNKIDEIIKIS